VTDEFDALLLLSFGGPEGPDDVLPFLENVVRGRGVPRERLLEVAGHYGHFGGVSPINDQNRELLAAIRAEVDLPVYWGNRNWHPLVEDTVARMRDDGVRRALVFVTSAYTSFSGCRQYQDDLARARAAVGEGAPELLKLRHYFNHPGFVEPVADGVRAALATVGPDARLVFTAHSIPTSMEVASGPGGHLYSTQLREASRLVAEAVRGPGAEFDVVWQSRSGPPSVPWLEPDINDHLRSLSADGVKSVVVSPIGFVSDHVEVLWDLDEEAKETAAELGLEYARAATVGTDPRFVRMVGRLVAERRSGAAKLALGPMGPSHDVCPLTCCPAPKRRPATA
jgi:protoporphyrin/coproporphyrin ferrochelatase